jgi:hypothetical protein
MRVFKTKGFQRWAAREGHSDEALRAAVTEMEDGLIDAKLGGYVVKKRVALPGRGKRGGSRTLVVYQQADKAFFVYGFAKNERANISDKELKGAQAVGHPVAGVYQPGPGQGDAGR